MPQEGSGEKGVPRTFAIQNNIKEETLSIHRDGENNGNEIGENITTVKGKSKHGVHVCRTPHQQGTVGGLSQEDGREEGCRDRWCDKRGI